MNEELKLYRKDRCEAGSEARKYLFDNTLCMSFLHMVYIAKFKVGWTIQFFIMSGNGSDVTEPVVPDCLLQYLRFRCIVTGDWSWDSKH